VSFAGFVGYSAEQDEFKGWVPGKAGSFADGIVASGAREYVSRGSAPRGGRWWNSTVAQ